MSQQSKKYKIELTLSELLLLDSEVSPDAQEIINLAKKEASYGFTEPKLSEILRASEQLGKLTWRNKQIRSCSLCNKTYDYYTYARSSRNHNKGEKDYSKPKYYSGIAFNEGFITIQGVGDFCSECNHKNNYTNQLIDYILDHDLKIEIQKNDYRETKYKKDDLHICFNCKKEIYESEMGKHRTVMGNGYYPCSCPHCGAESLLFGNSHKNTDKFRMIKKGK